MSPGKRQVTSTTSPTRSSTVTTYKSPVKTNETCEKGNDYHKETFNREVTEKKTTIDHSPVRDSKGVETYKKTVVTEKEETISKTEVLKVTELMGGEDKVPDILPNGRAKPCPEHVLTDEILKKHLQDVGQNQ